MWVSESANLHRAIGYLHANERDFVQAQLEVWRIRHDAANLEGSIQLLKGEMAGAEDAYLEAIDFAERAKYFYGKANAGMNLGGIYGWNQDTERAEQYLQEAIDFFEMTGRVNKLAEATYNLALVRRLANHFQEAIEPATKARELFERINRSSGATYAMQILAEVYTALNELEQAEHFALPG